MSDLERSTRLLDARINTLLDRAHTNMETWNQLRHHEMQLLQAQSLPELLNITLYQTAPTFELDAVSLVLVDPEHCLQKYLEQSTQKVDFSPGLTLVDSATDLKAFFEKIPKPWLGPYSAATHHSFFTNFALNTSAVGYSIAILPLLRSDRLLGCLSIASKDSERFQGTLNTDFLGHFAALLAICLENTQKQEALRCAGLTDALTQVPNRRYFEQRLREEMSRAERTASPLACLFLDIDFFKRINDRYGHRTGDRVLAQVAACIKTQLRTVDTLARYGGEEFIALLNDAEAELAKEIGERIRASVQALKIKTTEKETIPVTLSVGIAILTEHLSDPEVGCERLVEAADQALYQAKQAGRNQVVCAQNMAAVFAGIPG